MDERTPITAAYEEATRTAIERRRGRPLTLAERNIEIARLNRDLQDGKEALAAAIEQAKTRAIRAWARNGYRGKPRVRPDAQMHKVLEELHRKGREHGERELRRAGYRRAHADRMFGGREPRALRDAKRKLRTLLAGVNIRLDRHATALDLGTVARDKIISALEKVPGALDVASRLVSGTLYGGLGEAFDRASGDVDSAGARQGGNGWEYTAVMDDATCDPCTEADGTTYDTWDEAQADLPDGGPNPDCDGEGRCRCRLAPVPL